MIDNKIILLFIKAPVKGEVKSRLAADVGNEAALGLYKSFILDIISTVKRSNYAFRICFHPLEKETVVSEWLGHHCPVMPQQGVDLGLKMQDAFFRMFTEGFTSCVLIGSDIPDLPHSIFDEAFKSLESNDVVIGPAVDGGYYLIGFNKWTFQPVIFENIAWGTSTVYRETVRRIVDTQLRIHRLPLWQDVDNMGDLQSLFDRNRGTAFIKSETITYLLRTQLLK